MELFRLCRFLLDLPVWRKGESEDLFTQWKKSFSHNQGRFKTLTKQIQIKCEK